MDAATLSTLLATGATLLAAIAYAIKTLANARLVNAEAGKKRAEAKLADAESEKTRAAAEKRDADTTGQIVTGREADAAMVRDAFKDIRERLILAEARVTVAEARVTIAEASVKSCEERHAEAARVFEAERAAFAAAIATRDNQVSALFAEVGRLRDAIDAMRP